MLTSFRVITTLRLILQKYNHLVIVQITIIWNQSPQLAPLFWISVTQWPKPIYKLTKSVLGSQPHFCKSQRTHIHAQCLLCLWQVWDHTQVINLSVSLKHAWLLWPLHYQILLPPSSLSSAHRLVFSPSLITLIQCNGLKYLVSFTF